MLSFQAIREAPGHPYRPHRGTQDVLHFQTMEKKQHVVTKSTSNLLLILLYTSIYYIFSSKYQVMICIGIITPLESMRYLCSFGHVELGLGAPGCPWVPLAAPTMDMARRFCLASDHQIPTGGVIQTWTAGRSQKQEIWSGSTIWAHILL